jgi:GNAT superfamily N-acetyltransferase
MTQILIRPYQSIDLIAITELMSDLGYPTTTEDMQKRMEKIESLSDYHTFVAEREGQVAGMIGTRDVYYYEGDGLVTQISLLVVKSELQGHGIGRALLRFVEEWAKQNGASSLYLTSGMKPERLRAHAFYQQAGFVTNGYRFVKPL